ncbi:MAG: glycoside hydrolase family 2 TIM barrel-domain containing protein [Bryobacteraceae bacterium]|nr:glycoside hydrolase family 2 TIM barrel-domain containing protein [Bryobacteraceae bacterium]
MPSRRAFLAGAGAVPALAQSSPSPFLTDLCTTVPLDGLWRFRLDGETTQREVRVPHTWQVEPACASYYGVAWYEREFDVDAAWRDAAVRLEFEAVFHSATVWVNGAAAGEHLRKGYTAFTVDATRHLRFGERNVVRVRVSNAFDEAMLPRGRSSDWAHDGGIYRPVRLLVTPKVFVERLEIDAEPDLKGKASVEVRAVVRNASGRAASGSLGLQILDGATGLRAGTVQGQYAVSGGETTVVALRHQLEGVKLWHFDQPHLYRARVRLDGGHEVEDTFGVRKIEVRGTQFYLNGEAVRLMGVERMAGSHPDYGMAEPASWMEHDHADMRELNCVYTRVHWMQDRRVLDYCDRHGILIQTEVPTWGPRTFREPGAEPSADLMQNGLEQLREMIARDRNHPGIFSWGVCNEIDGGRPADAHFARTLYAEAKRLDPGRLVSYASNSAHTRLEKDVAGAMDYIMWNEYFESWMGGTVGDMAAKLDAIHAAFPVKPIVVSEYGYCACTAERPEGDEKRRDVLLGHDAVFRERPWVAGLIFFCYNDYRTHVGDKGQGALQQRVHGVVDVYGRRKPSWELLRRESSPVESLECEVSAKGFALQVRARTTVPAYIMRGYRVRAVVEGRGDIPLEVVDRPLQALAPGGLASVKGPLTEKDIRRVRFDVLRPDGCSTATLIYQRPAGAGI